MHAGRQDLAGREARTGVTVARHSCRPAAARGQSKVSQRSVAIAGSGRFEARKQCPVALGGMTMAHGKPAPQAAVKPLAAPVWNPSAIETRPVDSLKPYERNPRTHSPEQIAKVARSIEEFGWTNPILVDAKGVASNN